MGPKQVPVNPFLTNQVNDDYLYLCPNLSIFILSDSERVNSVFKTLIGLASDVRKIGLISQ